VSKDALNNMKSSRVNRSWGGRFSEAPDQLVARLNASVSFDQRMYVEDIEGSKVHAQMLGAQAIIPQGEVEQICAGLDQIKAEIQQGTWTWSDDLEDVHMNIEAELRARLGDAGARLHTARSRNDQVATDTRMWLITRIDTISEELERLIRGFITLATTNIEAILPGYTHLQRAQPVLLAHHLLAYVSMFERDLERLKDAQRRMSWSPLGSAALAGTPFPIDREMTAKALGFQGVIPNSMDAVSDRDFAVEFTSAAALCMVHLSRWSEELVLWSSQEFSFIELPDAFSTGSSIMPQKKNPDIPELVRGKTGRVIGDLVTLLTLLKGLPLAYNKDMQEDKEALFDAADTLLDCVTVTAALTPQIEVKHLNMRRACDEGYVTATDVADYLASRGLPFREAHHVVGRLIRWCITEDRSLTSLTLEEFQRFYPHFDEHILEQVKVESSVAARMSQGGTAPDRVRVALHEVSKRYL
jgi:argininosuccinate lyase